MFDLNNISVAAGGQPPATHFTLVIQLTTFDMYVLSENLVEKIYH